MLGGGEGGRGRRGQGGEEGVTKASRGAPQPIIRLGGEGVGGGAGGAMSEERRGEESPRMPSHVMLCYVVLPSRHKQYHLYDSADDMHTACSPSAFGYSVLSMISLLATPLMSAASATQSEARILATTGQGCIGVGGLLGSWAYRGLGRSGVWDFKVPARSSMW